MITKQQAKHVYTAYFPMRWCDMDAFGHANNSVYFSYFEQARVLWWRQIGLPMRLISDTGPVLITAECTFLKPLYFPANLQIEVFAGPPGHSSYMMYYELYLQDQLETLMAEGSTKVVWVNFKEHRSVPLPEQMIAHLPSLKS